MIFILQSQDIRTSYGMVSNPNCNLVTKGANLHGFDLSNCNLRGFDLLGTNLLGASLTNANLAGANLQGTVLIGADLSGANLINANLAGDNLQGAVLSGADLSRANLSIANLAGDNLQGAVLTGADLSTANLAGANLQGAVLLGTILSGADLSGANLINANLAGANLKGAFLTNTILDSKTITDHDTITIQTLGSSLVPGSTYTISPDPKTGLGSLTITDGGAGDEDGISDGMIKISQVPQGRYVINQVSIPSGFLSLLGSTTININPLNLDQTVTFQVIPAGTDLSTLKPTPITSPSLSNTTFNQWTRSFFATIVNNVNSRIITNVDQTPQIIVVGTQNSMAIETAINSQSSVLLNASFAPLTKGSAIINTMGLENYSLPDSTNVVSIIPTIVAKINNTTDYVAATPPLVGIIPGQEMIIPITDSLLPSFGGLKEIDVQSSTTAIPIGEKNKEWLVAEVDRKIPSSINSRGIYGTPLFFVNIQHPFEESGSGFNWSDPSNHEVPPLLTLAINKKTPNSIQKDFNNCPRVDAYTFVDDSWTSVGVGEISSRSISLSQCEIIIQSQHLSKFAFSLHHFSSLTLFGNTSNTVSTGIVNPPSYLAEAESQSSTPLTSNQSTTPSTISTTLNTTQSTPNTTHSIPAPSGGNLLQHIAQLNPLQRFSDFFTCIIGIKHC